MKMNENPFNLEELELGKGDYLGLERTWTPPS